MNVPALIYAGDTVKWSEPPTNEYSSETWTRTVAFRHRTDTDALSATGVAAGTGWDFAITATQSAAFGAGTLYWVDAVTSGAERYTIAQGDLEVRPSITAAATFDGRSQSEIDLDSLRAEIRARVSGGSVQEYSIGSRSLKKMPMPDLIALESKLKADVSLEKRRKRIAQGLDSGRSVFVRFRG